MAPRGSGEKPRYQPKRKNSQNKTTGSAEEETKQGSDSHKKEFVPKTDQFANDKSISILKNQTPAQVDEVLGALLDISQRDPNKWKNVIKGTWIVDSFKRIKKAGNTFYVKNSKDISQVINKLVPWVDRSAKKKLLNMFTDLTNEGEYTKGKINRIWARAEELLAMEEVPFEGRDIVFCDLEIYLKDQSGSACLDEHDLHRISSLIDTMEPYFTPKQTTKSRELYKSLLEISHDAEEEHPNHITKDDDSDEEVKEIKKQDKQPKPTKNALSLLNEENAALMAQLKLTDPNQIFEAITKILSKLQKLSPELKSVIATNKEAQTLMKTLAERLTWAEDNLSSNQRDQIWYLYERHWIRKHVEKWQKKAGGSKQKQKKGGKIVIDNRAFDTLIKALKRDLEYDTGSKDGQTWSKIATNVTQLFAHIEQQKSIDNPRAPIEAKALKKRLLTAVKEIEFEKPFLTIAKLENRFDEIFTAEDCAELRKAVKETKKSFDVTEAHEESTVKIVKKDATRKSSDGPKPKGAKWLKKSDSTHEDQPSEKKAQDDKKDKQSKVEKKTEKEEKKNSEDVRIFAVKPDTGRKTHKVFPTDVYTAEHAFDVSDLPEELQARDIITPEDISLDPGTLGHYNNLILEMVEQYKMTDRQIEEAKKICAGFVKAARRFEPESELQCYGSAVNSFGGKDADIDMTVITPKDTYCDRESEINLLKKIRKVVTSCISVPLSGQMSLIPARVPILQIYTRRGLELNVCVNNELATHNSRLLAKYTELDPRTLHLGLFIKLWAKQRGVCGAADGYLSSYSYIIMVIHFLQITRPQILPSLQKIAKKNGRTNEVTVRRNKDKVQGSFLADVAFEEDMAVIGKYMREEIKTPNTSCSLDLLIQFFYYFGYVFPELDASISISEASLVETREKDKNLFISLHDPFDPYVNMGGVVSMPQKYAKIVFEMKRAYWELSRGNLTGLLEECEHTFGKS